MAHYLIEFRFFGTAKQEIKQLIWEVNRKFHIFPKHKPVPHVTLVGPIITRQATQLIRDFKSLCDSSSIIHFEVGGYGTFEESRVVYINIKPATNLDNFRWKLSQTIQPYCKLQHYDYDPRFNYHATLAMKLPQNKFEQIKEYIKYKPQLSYNHVLLRATLLKNQRILVEYDFLTRKLLQRSEALSRTALDETFEKLKEYLGKGKLKKEDESIEHDNPKGIMGEIQSSKIEEISIPEKTGFFQKMFGKSRKVFLISDTHFDHTNIIRYCNRPFKNTSEMNDVMLKNWNDTIKNNDVVFFLGDMSYGRGSRSADYWMSKLNGNIFFIRGFKYDKSSGKRIQHDTISRKENVFDNLIIKYKGQKILLVHDTENVPKDWKGWVISGHHHNNKTGEHPLINKKTKQMNVSVELIDYKPISLDDLLKNI